MKKRVVSHHRFHCVRNTAVLVLSDARQFAAGGWNRRTREKKSRASLITVLHTYHQTDTSLSHTRK